MWTLQEKRLLLHCFLSFALIRKALQLFGFAGIIFQIQPNFIRLIKCCIICTSHILLNYKQPFCALATFGRNSILIQVGKYINNTMYLLQARVVFFEILLKWLHFNKMALISRNDVNEQTKPCSLVLTHWRRKPGAPCIKPMGMREFSHQWVNKSANKWTQVHE